MSSYRVAPVFVIRAAGVPFDELEKLATPRTAAAARALLVRRGEFEKSKNAVELLLRNRGHGLSEELFRAWRKAIRSGAMPPASDQASAAFVTCWECARDQAQVESALKEVMQQEFDAARAALLAASRKFLPPYLVFAVGGVRELLTRLLAEPGSDETPGSKRNARAGDRERHLFLYLQRVCAKNDTFSEFGPSAWGRVNARTAGMDFGRDSGVKERDTFLERWTAHAAAAAVNQDPAARPEISPRLNPNGRLEASAFFFSETNERILLDPETVRLLAWCNGKTPAYKLELPLERLEQLARQDIIRWQLDAPALDAHAFASLHAEISEWREGEARRHWLDTLAPLAALPARFAETPEVAPRIEMMNEARERLAGLGVEQKTSQRLLYAAGNPIAEECFRSGDVTVNEGVLDEFLREAGPWIELWRDTYAYVASQVAAGLRHFYETAPKQEGAVPLPAFLRHCAINGMPLTGHGSVVLAHRAFQQVRAAFCKRMDGRPAAAELQLTTEDCHGGIL